MKMTPVDVNVSSLSDLLTILVGACLEAGQPCNWTILATVAFQNPSKKYIEDIKCYLLNASSVLHSFHGYLQISSNCNGNNSFLQTYLPGNSGSQPVPVSFSTFEHERRITAETFKNSSELSRNIGLYVMKIFY